MVHPSTLCSASMYPCCCCCCFFKLHFSVITSLQIFDIVEAVACIPGSFRCSGGQAKTPFGERLVLPMRAMLYSLCKAWLRFLAFFFFKRGQVVLCITINPPPTHLPLSQSLFFLRSVSLSPHAHTLLCPLAHTDTRIYPMRALEKKILYVWRFML